jgi:hypothetical protein
VNEIVTGGTFGRPSHVQFVHAPCQPSRIVV